MKKLLLGASIIFAGIFSANAQTFYFQNFEASTTNMPAGWDTSWINANHPGNSGFKFADAWPAAAAAWLANNPTHTYVVYVDDRDPNNTSPKVDYDTVYSSAFSCTGKPNVFISFDLNFNNYTTYEVGTIAVSANGGPWVTAVTLPVYSGDCSWHDSLIYNISAQAGGVASVKVAFCWNNAGAVSHDAAPGWGMAVDNIAVYAPLAFDLSATSVNSTYLMQVGTPYVFTGTEYNWGSTAITSMDMHFKAGATSGTAVIPGIAGFNALTSYNWSFGSTTFTPTVAGPVSIKFWADNLNGANVDQNHQNDTLVANFLVVDSIQNKAVMFEEFSCASCNPCMYAMPNIDSVAQNCVAYCNTIRYHWYFPGEDMINNETSAICNGRMNTYYDKYGVPDAQLDGVYSPYPGYGGLSTAWVQAAKSIGSPMKIDITTATYDNQTQVWTCKADIKSYAAFPAGLVAQCYVTEDSVDFKGDQSTEDPPSSFPGTNPWYYYDFILNFPDAVEFAMPSISGTSLAAFTAGSTQTINVTATKTHPWAAERATWPYDSSKTQHITVFVQDNNGETNMGVPAQYVYQSQKVLVTNLGLGLQEIGEGVSFNMYPNPTNSNTNLSFQLAKDQNVTVEVYNMVGQQVYSDNEGLLSSGTHTITIDGQGLKSGVYFVRFTSDNATTTQKLIIQK